jgi:hypothetical protein
VTAELWRLFAWRAAWFWVAVHAVIRVAGAIVAQATGVDPFGSGPSQSAWMVVMAGTMLGLDILRNRERLLLHDLGVRVRILVPLATAPVALLEIALAFAGW